MPLLLLLLSDGDDGDIETPARPPDVFANDADYALARRILTRVRSEIRRAGEGLWTLPSGGGTTTAAAAAEEWTRANALVSVAGNSELFARFTSGELAPWRRPVWRVRMAGDETARALELGTRLRRADRGSGDAAMLTGETLGIVRRVETRTVGGFVVTTTAYVAAAL